MPAANRCRNIAAMAVLTTASALGPLTASAATAPPIGIGTRMGLTTGIGVEANIELHRFFDLRAGGNFGYFHYNDTDDGTDYRAKLSYTSFSGFIDYKPFGGGFRISAGLYSNPLKLDAHASGEDKYEFDDREYNGDLDVDGKIRLGNAVPYLGIGWGGTAGGSGFGASFDLGVQFTRSPDVSLRVRGRACDRELSGDNCDPHGPESFDVADYAQIQDDIAGEIRELEDDAKDFKLMPVMTIGLHYRFGQSRNQPLGTPAVMKSSAAAASERTPAPASAAPAASAVPEESAAPVTTPCPSCAAAVGAPVMQSRPGAQTVTLPRNLVLRPQPLADARSSNYVAAGSRVEKSDRQVTAQGVWWFVRTSTGVGGWVTETELQP